MSNTPHRPSVALGKSAGTGILGGFESPREPRSRVIQAVPPVSVPHTLSSAFSGVFYVFAEWK